MIENLAKIDVPSNKPSRQQHHQAPQPIHLRASRHQIALRPRLTHTFTRNASQGGSRGRLYREDSGAGGGQSARLNPARRARGKGEPNIEALHSAEQSQLPRRKTASGRTDLQHLLPPPQHLEHPRPHLLRQESTKPRRSAVAS